MAYKVEVREFTENFNKFQDIDIVEIIDKKSNVLKGLYISAKEAQKIKKLSKIVQDIMIDRNGKDNFICIDLLDNNYLVEKERKKEILTKTLGLIKNKIDPIKWQEELRQEMER